MSPKSVQFSVIMIQEIEECVIDLCISKYVCVYVYVMVENYRIREKK